MNNEKSYSRLLWTRQEQELLKKLREQENIQSWKLISTFLNKTFSGKYRTGKQCRERYTNYVKFGSQNPKINTWNSDQDVLIFEKFMKYGPKWVIIAKQMVGKSQNCLKNRFYGIVRKIVRKLELLEKQNKAKHRKNIKSNIFIRILEPKNKQVIKSMNENNEKQAVIEKLKKCVYDFVSHHQEDMDKENIRKLMSLLNQYTLILKNESIQAKNKKCLVQKKEIAEQQNISGTENKIQSLQVQEAEKQSAQKKQQFQMTKSNYYDQSPRPKRTENIIIVMPNFENNQKPQQWYPQNIFNPFSYFPYFLNPQLLQI